MRSITTYKEVIHAVAHSFPLNEVPSSLIVAIDALKNAELEWDKAYKALRQTVYDCTEKTENKHDTRRKILDSI